MDKTSIKILLAEDNPADVVFLRETLEKDTITSFELTPVERLGAALELLKNHPFDVILLDLGLPDSQGLVTFTHIHRAMPELPKVILSGLADEVFALQAVQAGAQDYLVKGPVGFSVAARAIRYAIERQMAQKALRESEARFATVFRASPLSIALTKLKDNRLIDVNPAWQRQTGFTRAEVIGRAARELNVWVNLNDRERMLRQMSEHGITAGFEIQIRHKSGRVSDLLMSAELVELAGEPCMLSLALDITERKKAEEALRESEERYRDLVENSHDLIQSVAPDGRFLFVNHTWLETLEYTAADLPGLNLWHILHPDSRAKCEQEFTALLQGQGSSTIRPTFITKSGAAVDGEGVVMAHMENGKLIATNAFFRNVTEKRQIERVQATQVAVSRILAESPEVEAALAQVLEAIAVSLDWQVAELWLQDAAGETLVWHSGWHTPERVELAEFEAASRLYTFARGNGLPGRAWAARETIWETDVATSFSFAHAKLTTQADLHTAIAIPIIRGNQVPGVMVFFSRSRRALDAPLSATLSDLGRQIGQFVARKWAELALETERASLARRVEERTADLSQANAELAKIARAKDEFLANMSHELRTPLNAILNFSESLLEGIRGPLNERQQVAVQHIETSGRHLLGLINDILDLSKVEAGQMSLQLQPTIIADVCQASMLFVKEVVSKKSLKLAFQLNDQAAKIEADPKRLKQMLVNLLSNAVKFTPDGGQVSLEVTVEAGAGVVHFAVQDTGIGISPESITRLFQPFTQLDSSLSRQYEGTGLGLALVRRLAELHGGSVMVESEVGRGSRFTITLPYHPQKTAKAKPATGPQSGRKTKTDPLRSAPGSETLGVPGRLILLAEDSEANLMTIGDYLRYNSYSVVVARNGQEALDRAEETPPDLILMDIQLPEMDGLEATRRLRARPKFVATPIIALTALAMPGDRERCLAAGVNEYIAKPVRLKELVETVERLLEK